MEFIWKLIMTLTLSTSLLTGTTPPAKAPQPPSRLVVRLDVREQRDGLVMDRHYTRPDKIEAVLYYLRGLSPGKRAEVDPERYLGSAYTITLHFSDSRRSIYRQRADQWLSKNSRPWQTIDPQKAELLPVLLDILPGDG